MDGNLSLGNDLQDSSWVKMQSYLIRSSTRVEYMVQGWFWEMAMQKIFSNNTHKYCRQGLTGSSSSSSSVRLYTTKRNAMPACRRGVQLGFFERNMDAYRVEVCGK